MNISIQEKFDPDKGPIIAVQGEVDVYTAPKLRERLLPLCEKGTTVTVDLSGVEYIDSTGLGVLIGAYKAQRATAGKLVLTGMNGRLLRLFKITGLHEIIDIEETT